MKINLNRALSLLTKKFVVNTDIFRPLSKATIILWGEEVLAAIELEKRTGLENLYKLTQPQHAFLIGEIQGF